MNNTIGTTLSNHPTISCFLLKVASRCNLNCDYCYMYQHADQSWKKQPKFMSFDTVKNLASRINSYCIENGIKNIVVVFHGGEPLLYGVKKIISIKQTIEKLCFENVDIDFSMQTNGVLLDEESLLLLDLEKIGVSLSLDGPQLINDTHRLDHKGNSTFSQTLKALEMLEKYPRVFSGVISVIDPNFHPKEYFDFFSKFFIPRLDFLLPDANYVQPPPGRDKDSEIYVRWLIQAFDLWFDQYSHISVRFFEALLGAILGVPSGTDAFGFGDVSLLTIESDGSYQGLDVLKITKEGGADLGNFNVQSHDVSNVLDSSQVQLHRKLLTADGLSNKCRSCDIVGICGGGSVPHRFSNENDFLNPTVYCKEMIHLVQHATNRLNEQLEKESEEQRKMFLDSELIKKYMSSATSKEIIDGFVQSWAAQNLSNLSMIAERESDVASFLKSLDELPVVEQTRLLIHPSLVLWSNLKKQLVQGFTLKAIDNSTIDANKVSFPSLLGRKSFPQIHSDDPLLRLPFGKSIIFEDPSILLKSKEAINSALSLIKKWKPSFLEEMELISFEIQLIRDPEAHEDKIVSFSDNSVPGALYVSVSHRGAIIDYHNLADSLVHEHRHQKLYLLERECNLIVDDSIRLKSPWREDLRPPSGIIHAIFVFVELLDFWLFVFEEDNSLVMASASIDDIIDKLNEGFTELRKAQLTESGSTLVEELHSQFKQLKDKKGMYCEK